VGAGGFTDMLADVEAAEGRPLVVVPATRPDIVLGVGAAQAGCRVYHYLQPAVEDLPLHSREHPDAQRDTGVQLKQVHPQNQALADLCCVHAGGWRRASPCRCAGHRREAAG
jgi:hypothetical protein